MAWTKIEVHKDDVIYLSHAKFDALDDKLSGIFSIPCSSGLEVGDTFRADDVFFQVDALEDVMDRGEVFLIHAVEVKNDKPKTRRSKPKSGQAPTERTNNDGRDSAD